MKALYLVQDDKDYKLVEAAAPWLESLGYEVETARFKASGDVLEEVRQLSDVLRAYERVAVLQPPVLPMAFDDIVGMFGDLHAEVLLDGSLSLDMFVIERACAVGMRHVLAGFDGEQVRGMEFRRLFTLAALGAAREASLCASAEWHMTPDMQLPKAFGKWASCINVASRAVLDMSRAAKLDVHEVIARHMENIVAELLTKEGVCHG